MKKNEKELLDGAFLGQELLFFCSENFLSQESPKNIEHLKNYFNLQPLKKDSQVHFSVFFVSEDEIIPFKKEYPNSFLCSLKPQPEAYFFDISDTTETNDLLTFFLEMKRSFLIKEATLKTYDFLQKTLAQGSRSVLESEDAKKTLKFFLREPIEIFEEVNLKKFVKAIEKHTNSLNIFRKITLCEENNLISSLDEYDVVIPLIFSQNKEFVCFQKKQVINQEFFFFNIGLVFQWLEKYYKVHHHRLALEYKRTLWEEAVHQIPFPIAMFSEDGNLVKFNDLFAQLRVLPGQCLEFSDEESVELNQDFYLIRKDKVSLKNNSLILMSFYQDHEATTRRKDLSTMTSQDLGIITSSIAHELNNPLAGILASIVLLELEDWDQEGEEALGEMKESAERCKDLVRIFLGFSKASSSYQDFGELQTGLVKALDLLRFRMIQDETMIDVVHEKKHQKNFGVSVSIPVATMVFYLIFGELLTQYNHQKLIAEESLAKNLEVLTLEDNKVFSIELPENIDIQLRLRNSRLLQYLINILGLELTIEGRRIMMTTWMLM